MPNKSITVLNGDGSTRTITIPDRSRYAGRRTITKEDGSTLTVDRTAPVITSDRKGQSRPLLSKLVGGAAAAYSLRDLNDRAGRNKVVRVRRSSDNAEKDFTALQVSSGEMTNWVNSQIVPPLDIGVETADGRPSVPEGGTSIGTPAAAYSLRNLSTTYTGNVVEVRRSSDDAERDFTAAELADGTLEDWVNEDVVKYESDFSAGTDGWTGQNGSLVGNEDGIFGKDNVAKYTINTSTSSFHQIYESGLMQEGNAFRVEADVYFPSSNSHIDGLAFSKDADVYATFSSQQTDQWITLSAEFTYTSSSTVLGLRFRDGNSFTITDSAGDDVVYIHNIRVTQTTANGHVSTWYDQSGNDNHATQTDNAKQPKIVDAGTYLEEIDFPSSSATLGFSNIACGTTYSLFCALPRLDVNNFKILSDGGGAPRIDFESGHPDKIEVVDNNYSNKKFDTSNAFIDNDNLTSIINASTAVNVFYNGNASSTNPFTIPNNNTFNTLGGQAAGGAYELIIYTSDQSDNRAAIEANIGEHYGISGIPAYDNTVDGYVETWYDQSGNGNDAVQTVAANQPKIVGEVESGQPHKFLGEVDFLEGTNTFLQTENSDLCNVDELSIFTVLEPHIAASQCVAFSCGSVVKDSSSYGGWKLHLNGYTNTALFQTQAVGNSAVTSLGSSVTAGDTLLSYVATFPNASAFTNGQAGATTTSAVSPDNNSEFRRRFRIGCQYTYQTASFYTQPIKEIIIYGSDQSANREAIEANINNQYSIY